jgi:hypothetical protein
VSPPAVRTCTTCANSRQIPAQLGGQTLAPGCYNAANTAFGLTGTLTLSGAGSYVFTTPAALNTADSSVVALVNGAFCSQIDWCIGAAATLGANSVFNGNIHTVAGAITLGANAVVHGSVTAGNNVVTYGSGAVVTSCDDDVSPPGSVSCPSAGQVYTPGTYAFGTNIAANGVITLSGLGLYHFTGVALTTGANSIIQLANGAQCSDVTWALTTFTSGANSVMVGAITCTTATLGANSLIEGSVSAPTITRGSGSVVKACNALSASSGAYTPGTYAIGTNIVANGVITLTGAGLYHFTGGALTTGANSVIVLQGGALCSGVSWTLDTLTSGANSVLVGSVSATTATLGAHSLIQGGLQAVTLTRGAGAVVESC